MSRALKLLAGFALGGVLLWLALRQVDGAALLAATRGVNGPMLLAAPLALALGYVCRVRRWWLMLRPHNPALGQGRAAVAFLASIAGNNLAPFRLGDALRCFGFSRWLGVPNGAVLGTVLIERVLDMLAVLLALGLALWMVAPGAASGLVGPAVVGMGAGAVLLVLWPGILAPPLRALARMIGRLGPQAQARAEGFLGPLIDALTTLSTGPARAALIGWTVPVWLFEGASYWAVALAMPALPLPGAAWLAMPAGTLATLLPTTPGHIGAFDYVAQLATVAAGNPLAEATAFVIVVHLMLWLTTTLAGGLCLLIWALQRKQAA